MYVLYVYIMYGGEHVCIVMYCSVLVTQRILGFASWIPDAASYHSCGDSDRFLYYDRLFASDGGECEAH